MLAYYRPPRSPYLAILLENHFPPGLRADSSAITVPAAGSLPHYHYLRLCYRENATCARLARGNLTIRFSGCYEGTAIAARVSRPLWSHVRACVRACT